MTGYFISVEGIEGVGKSTAVKFIYEYLSQAQKKTILTREPGGTEIAENIRHVLLTPHHQEKMTSDAELLLMFAARAQHIKHVIQPAIAAGSWIVCDRFVDASYAYQGGGRYINVNYINMLEEWIVGNVKPNITILLDAPPEIGLARAKHRGPHDRIEQEKIDFFNRVREAYLKRAAENASRFRIIDATQDLSDVQNNLIQLLSELI